MGTEIDKVESKFTQDRRRFFEKRLIGRLGRAPTKTELIRIGAITVIETIGMLGLVVGPSIWAHYNLGEPYSTLIWLTSSVAVVPAGILLMKYSPDVAISVDNQILRAAHSLSLRNHS